MSYCVHCGVELAASEKICPLCNTEVLDPSASSASSISYPYPEQVQRPVSFRKGAATFLSLALVIPLLCVFIADLSLHGTISWSAIAGGAIILFFFVFLFPNLFSRRKLWLFLLLDIPMVWLYQCGICLLLKKSWWLMPALPLTLLTGALVMGIYLMFSAKKPTFGLKCIVMLISVMLFSVCTQIVIELYLHSVISLSWSIYIAVACAGTSIVILVIDSMYHFSEKIRKKIFM